MRQYKLLEIESQYEQYLRKFYKEHQEIDGLSYDELFSMLVEDSFGASNFVHSQLYDLGVESKIVFYNNRNLQDKWDSGYKSASYFDILLRQIKEFSPDVILVSDISGFTKEQTTLIKTASPVVKKMVGFHFTSLDDRFMQNVSFYDQIYTGSRAYVEMMRGCDIPAYLLRHAFEPKILEKISASERRNEVCFSGSIIAAGHDDRLDMLEKLKKTDIPYAFYGYISGYTQEDEKYKDIIKEVNEAKKTEMFGLDYYKALNRYSICLNLHCSLNGDGAGNARMFEVTGVGSCLLTDYRKENAEVFDVDKEIVVYDSLDDMAEKARWLLEHPEKAEEIALAGQKRTLAVYTYKNKAEQLNEYIQELLS